MYVRTYPEDDMVIIERVALLLPTESTHKLIKTVIRRLTLNVT